MKSCKIRNWLKISPIIKKIEKRKVHSSFIDNIWGANLADIQLLSKFNKGVRFLLCVIDIYNKDKKGITITNDFNNFLHESGRKPNKIWVDRGREF